MPLGSTNYFRKLLIALLLSCAITIVVNVMDDSCVTVFAEIVKILAKIRVKIVWNINIQNSLNIDIKIDKIGKQRYRQRRVSTKTRKRRKNERHK